MGGEQAANVLASIKKDQMMAQKKTFSKEEENKLVSDILSKYETEGSALYSTARLWDDGIIDPADTRKILAMGIAASLNKKFEDTKYGIFRM